MADGGPQSTFDLQNYYAASLCQPMLARKRSYRLRNFKTCKKLVRWMQHSESTRGSLLPTTHKIWKAETRPLINNTYKLKCLDWAKISQDWFNQMFYGLNPSEISWSLPKSQICWEAKQNTSLKSVWRLWLVWHKKLILNKIKKLIPWIDDFKVLWNMSVVCKIVRS